MANIAISELDTETTSLGDNDLLLVSKDNGGSYTSAKMRGSVLKSGVIDIVSINEKLDSIVTKIDDLSISQKVNFDLLIEMNTKIGNKVFGQAGGEISSTEMYTLTLNKSSYSNTLIELISEPTGGGTYNKGARAIIAAERMLYPVAFSGWFDENNNRITTNLTYSIEVNRDTTLRAVYTLYTSTVNEYIPCYINCINRSDYDVFTIFDPSRYFSTKIPKQKNDTIIKIPQILYTTSQWFSTNPFVDNSKIKISFDPRYNLSDFWITSPRLMTKDGSSYWYVVSRQQPNDGDTLPGVFLIENA